MTRDPIARELGRMRAVRRGLAIGAWTGGEAIGVWHRGELPAGARSVFEIGSVTKVFTATLLVDMARDGVLGLNDPVRLHLPAGAEPPSRQRDITLADLASHRSGLPAVPRELLLRAFTTDRGNPYARWDRAKVEATIARTPARRAPSERFHYSNWGVGLLGHALAWRAGMSYEELVRERISGPLRLDDTGLATGPLAPGHGRLGGPVGPWDLAALAGAGGLRSTAPDVVAFLRAFAAGGRFADHATEMRRPRIRAGRAHVGLGWLLLPPNRRLPYAALIHEGGTGGFRSFAGVLPDSGAAVAVLSSQARGVGLIGLRLLRALTANG